VRETLAELEDRYGSLPEEARLLGEVMSDKTLVRRTGARAYELTAGRLVLSAGVDARLDRPRSCGWFSTGEAAGNSRLT